MTRKLTLFTTTAFLPRTRLSSTRKFKKNLPNIEELYKYRFPYQDVREVLENKAPQLKEKILAALKNENREEIWGVGTETFQVKF